MNINVNKDTKMAIWDNGDKTVTIYNENILYAFKHGKQMVMIKEKDKEGKTGFSAYEISGKKLFSYKYLGNQMDIGTTEKISVRGEIIAANYNEVKKEIIILFNYEGNRKLSLYKNNGYFITEIPSPIGYAFCALKNDGTNCIVVAQGINDLTRDEFGRNDWNFIINFENYYVERGSIIQ